MQKLLCTLLLSAVAGFAAPIPFYQSINPAPSSFEMQPGETRETYFQALFDVTLTQLGALIDPASSSTSYSWRLYESDGSKNFGSQLLNTSAQFTDAGLDTYDTAVNVSLMAGSYYILQLLAPSATTMGVSTLAAPFTAGDFLVIDGGANGPPNSFDNQFLPTFSVASRRTNAPGIIPEPASLALLVSGLACLLAFRRQIA